jgi:hypothetical protein
MRNDAEVRTDEYFAAKDELFSLEEKLKVFDSTEHVITAKDVELYLKNVMFRCCFALFFYFRLFIRLE